MNHKYYLLDLPSSISGTEFDAAYAKWGDGWRLPTLSEVKELLDKCSWLASTSEGINGIYITGPNGNSIFLPATGFYNGEGINFQGTFGTYWIGEQDKQDKLKAYFLSFDDNRGWGGWSNGYRFTGRPIRPVRDKQ